MLVLLIVFLYIVCGIITAMLMARFGDLKPEEGDPQVISVISMWPIAILIFIIFVTNYALTKLVLAARKGK